MAQVIVGQPLTVPGGIQLGPNSPRQQQQQQEPICNLCGPWEFGQFGSCGAANCCAVINGITLIIFGTISLGLGAAVAGYYTNFNGYAYAPIWAGILVSLSSRSWAYY